MFAMTSSQFRYLNSTVKMLRKHLLPHRFDQTGNYKERVFTGVIAFRVLSHAAIEDYFESRAVEIAKAALHACRNDGKITRPALALLGFSGIELRPPPETLDAPQETKKAIWQKEIDVDKRLGDCASRFIRKIKNDNHGVRERNILSILLPVGVDPSVIDRLFLSEMEDFGKKRGEYAHTSPQLHTTLKPNPEDELNKVTNLIEWIRPIDQNLDQLLRRTR